MSLRSRSSSLLSTTDEDELEMIKEPEREKMKYDTKLDAVFDLVLDLRQQDLDQYKLYKSKKEEAELEPEPEPEKSPEEPRYRFKHPCGVNEVTVSNLGKQSDLEKVILPTKTLKIEETSEPIRQTRDIVPLIVKTTRLDTESVTLHIEEDDITVGLKRKNDHPEIKTNSSESNSVQSNTKDKSKLNVNSSGHQTPTQRISTASSGPVIGDKVSPESQIRFPDK